MVLKSVYGRCLVGLLAIVSAAAISLTALPAIAQPVAPAQAQGDESTVLEAREALRKKDRDRLAAARTLATAERHPLAMWVDYWELSNRLADAQQEEIDAFAEHWKGTYVEDRLRNDWLLELGRRADWVHFAQEYPRFRMNDDRDVACYALLVEHLGGSDVRAAARAAWAAQRDADEGCAAMASTLYEAGRFNASDVWRKARLAVEGGRPRAARQAVDLIGPSASKAFDEVLKSPTRYLTRKASAKGRTAAELTTLALMRMAGNDADAAAGLLDSHWQHQLPKDLAAWAWMTVAKQAALDLDAQAADYFTRAATAAKGATDPDWPDELLAWKARAALRADNGSPRWQQVTQAIAAMSDSAQNEPTWIYWKARALQALAADSQDGESLGRMSRELLESLSGQMHFYGMLAAEDLARPLALPPRPSPLTPAESAAVAANPGLVRALQLIGMGLRSEGVREWNYALRGMEERELLAAAQLACDREVWDRCINTSERTRGEIDMAQRFPTPFRAEVSDQTREIGLDPAYVYGLIRQESRFVMDARSGVGASGLMQIMPATARWTARKIGLSYHPGLIADRDTNLRLGASYLKLVLDSFGGSQALAAAAYNAGPRRPRRWREGPVLEPAIWAENIPFPETRDYVKKVLTNAVYYAAVLGTPDAALKPRLGRSIGPASEVEPADDKDLP